MTWEFRLALETKDVREKFKIWLFKIGSMSSQILLTRQAMYVQHNTEVRLCSHCCSGKAIRFTYFKSAFVALRTQHAMRIRPIVTCSLPGSTLFLHIISYTERFLKKVTEHEIYVLISSITFV